MADETYEPHERPGMGLLQKLGGVTVNGMPPIGHPDDIILHPDEGPQEPVEAFVLRLDEREKPFYIEEDFYLRMRQGTKRVRIRSVDVQITETLRDMLRPKQPKVNNRNGQPLTDIELQDKFPKYAEAMRHFNRNLGHILILYGTIGLVLTNEAGEEVWNTAMADQDPHTISKEGLGKACVALDGMGLSESAFIQWFQAINRICEAQERESDADFLSESDGNSGYL